MQNAEFRMQNAECRMQNAECRMQNAECRMQNAECRMQNAKLNKKFGRGCPNFSFFNPSVTEYRDTSLYTKEARGVAEFLDVQ